MSGPNEVLERNQRRVVLISLITRLAQLPSAALMEIRCHARSQFLLRQCFAQYSDQRLNKALVRIYSHPNDVQPGLKVSEALIQVVLGHDRKNLAHKREDFRTARIGERQLSPEHERELRDRQQAKDIIKSRARDRQGEGNRTQGFERERDRDG